MKVLLLEIEENAKEFLVEILQNIPEIKKILATSSGEEAISLAHKEKPDLILLDTELDGQGMDGLQVGRVLFENNQDTLIVFISGYVKYALESFDVHPYDYILKPVNKNRLIKLIQEVSVKNENSGSRFLTITYENEIKQLDVKEIIFIEKENNFCYIHSVDGVYKIYQTLQKLQDLLGTLIFRAHKSYLINYEHIDTIKANPNRTYQVEFKNYIEIAMMSRQGYKEYKASQETQGDVFIGTLRYYQSK